MAILDLFIPGRVKSNLSRDLADLTALAYAQSKSSGLSKQRTELWQAFCDGAADLFTQLFIGSRDKQFDWGLKGHRRKLNEPRMSAVYWWLLLFQLVILRNRGLEGYDKDQEFDSLCQVAHDFIDTLASSADNATVNPGPWEPKWDRQVSLEAALGLYNRMMQVFGLRVDLEERIARVSLFTSASERAYDTNIREPFSNRCSDAQSESS